MGSARSARASRTLGALLVVVAGVVAVPVCGITGLAAADYYHASSWPIEFTALYLGVGAAWLLLVLTTISGRVRLIAASTLAFVATLVGVFTTYLTRLT